MCAVCYRAVNKHDQILLMILMIFFFQSINQQVGTQLSVSLRKCTWEECIVEGVLQFKFSVHPYASVFSKTNIVSYLAVSITNTCLYHKWGQFVQMCWFSSVFSPHIWQHISYKWITCAGRSTDKKNVCFTKRKGNRFLQN